MNDRFLDIYYKLVFYKEYVVKKLNESEEYLNTSEINKHIESINLHSGLFKKEYNVKANSKLNVKDMNKYIYLMYNDLSILYKILNNLSVERFNRLEDQIETSLLSLSSSVSLYTQRSQLELNSSYLGETLFFKDVDLSNSYGNIDLGEVNLHEGSTIACIVSGTNLKQDKLRFRFSREGSDTLYVGPHNFNQTILEIPGVVKTNSYNLEGESLGGRVMQLEVPEDTELVEGSSYSAFNGVNKIKISDRDSKEVSYIDISNKSSIRIPGNSFISFYAQPNCHIGFEYSESPIYSSFEGVSLSTEDESSHVVIECPANFILSIGANKDIYADKEKCFIDEDMLIFPKYTPMKDFVLVELLPKEDKAYNTSIEVMDPDISIDYIAIKELIRE